MKSPLIDIDLVKLLAKPEAWNCLDEVEKRQILDLLPDHIHPIPDPPGEDGTEAKIPPLPESFLRYSNHWRNGVRQFQVDLENGRYDPEWLRQAAEASQERAEGRFDKFKEEEFEQFWGQKQKLNYSVIAGESSRVKLVTLIEEGLVRVGDVWKYSRSFGKGGSRILVEKEAKIMEINGATLSFVIPPGQRVFVPQTQSPVTHESPRSNSSTDHEVHAENEASVVIATDKEMSTPPGGKRKNRNSMRSRPEAPKRSRRNKQDQNCTESQFQAKEDEEVLPISESEKEETPATMQNSNQEAESGAIEASSNPSDKEPEQRGQQVKDELSSSSNVSVIQVPNITGPQALVTRILKTDGRITHPPNGNAWKEIRCYRNNQDMGSLWEIRETWFVKQN